MGVASKITLGTFDSLFGGAESIVDLNLSELHTFENHPFIVADDNSMNELVESIKEKGVINPVIVREKNGSYEIISGHRRKRACELAGKATIPAIVKNIDDDEAKILMVDSNIYRESFLPSEKAFAYKAKQEALKHQGKKGSNTNEEIGKDLGDSGRQVQRYIRLTFLIPELLEYVDNGNIAIVPAVDLSYINEKSQKLLYQYIDDNCVFPNLQTAKKLKEAFNENKTLTTDVIDEILKKKTAKKSYTFKLTDTLIEKYFSGMDKKSIEAKVEKIILDYLNSEKEKR